MSESQIRSQLNTLVSAVSDTGYVYDYQRYANQWDSFLSLYGKQVGDKMIIKGWSISCDRISLDERPWDDNPTNSSALFSLDYSYILRGFYGVDDSEATEKTALAVAIDVMQAIIEGRDTIADPANSAGVEYVNLPSLDVFEIRLFGGVACHYAQITLNVRGLVTGATI